jgi:hypothetical protein
MHGYSNSGVDPEIVVKYFNTKNFKDSQNLWIPFKSRVIQNYKNYIKEISASSLAGRIDSKTPTINIYSCP